MYTVFINDTPLHFCTRTDVPEQSDSGLNPVFFDMTGGGLISNCVDMLEKSNRFEAIYLVNKNPKKLFGHFQKKYKIIEAGGGIVINEKEEVLIIYRFNTYDLPKGKMEKEEIPRETAHREVEEETGVKSLVTNDLHCITYHTYRNRKNRRVLKRTYWFMMEAPSQSLIPEEKEGIEKAEWVAHGKVKNLYGNMYGAIRDILIGLGYT